MRRAAVDQALCGWVPAGGMRAAAAAVRLGFHAAASVQSHAARGWIADRQLGNSLARLLWCKGTCEYAVTALVVGWWH